MSTNRTTNYNLHAWEPGDDFLRGEFNENFAAVDAAMAAIAGTVSEEAAARDAAVAAEAESRDAAVAAEAAARSAEIEAKIVTGTYTGDGTDSQFISLGFTPKAVLVMCHNGGTSESGRYYGGLVLPGAPATYSSNVYLSITEGGFLASRTSYINDSKVYHADANVSGDLYRYIAIP